MDLGCLDCGCISLSDEKKTSIESPTTQSSNSSSGSGSVSGKNKSPRGSPPSSGLHALNRFTCQIKKPPHRKTSPPLNWFPRKKVDSYLKRKIKLLQEAGGMNDTLDETLGHTYPHYCQVEREKIAAREAACKVMEARKAAMVEASWCRILQAARIPNKEADALLLKAEKEVAEAIEAATAKGLIMYDAPDRPRKHFEIETSSVGGKGSTTHTVKASFETAFEVDKQVAAAVKTAFTQLAHSGSFNKDEIKDLLRKISENPENQELSEPGTGSELEAGTRDGDNEDGFSSQKFNGTKLVDMMLERLKCLKEEELASLATIVATCGLNAALADGEGCKRMQDQISATNVEHLMSGAMRAKQVEQELPSLDKFLVKKMTKLEKEVQEARIARKAETSTTGGDDKQVSVDHVLDLGSVLVKHSSKLEKEIEEVKKTQNSSEMGGRKLGGRMHNHGKNRQFKQEDSEVPSLDQVLVKHVSRLEREVQDAKNRRRETEKENVDSNNHRNENTEQEDSLDKILVKPLHRLEREKIQAISQGKEGGEWNYRRKQGKTNNDVDGCESLDKVLVKHVCRLEKEKLRVDTNEVLEVKKKGSSAQSDTSVGGLDQVLVKHKSRLEREKNVASQKPPEDDGKSHSIMSRREARERELFEAWGGIGLGNSIRPHVSRLERDKVAWLKAEEEERRIALQEQ